MSLLKLERLSIPNARRILLLDPQLAGVAGDMILGALISLGADPRSVRESVRSVATHLEGCRSVDLAVSDVKRGEFQAKRAEVKLKERYSSRTGAELLRAMEAVAEENSFDRSQRMLAVNSLKTLVKAEAELHGEAVERVALDEAGSADTLADIAGVVTALRDLGIDSDYEVYTLPVAVGGGFFKFSHGISQSPAPAVIGITSEYQMPILGGPAEVELATPTGVALLANMSTQKVSRYPLIRPERVGYGAGARNFAEFPNVLRAVLGQGGSERVAEEVVVLETNLDDVSGELLGFLAERLREEGALDVTVMSALGKKNRPVQVLRAISKPNLADHLTEIIFEESGTLGIRMYSTMREVVSREIHRVSVKIRGKRWRVRVKISRRSNGEILQVKPEFDDLARLARQVKLPLRKLFDLVVREAAYAD